MIQEKANSTATEKNAHNVKYTYHLLLDEKTEANKVDNDTHRVIYFSKVPSDRSIDQYINRSIA